MTTEQNRVVAWRLKLLRQADDLPRGIAQACRHFGLSRKTILQMESQIQEPR
jgi:hypothetical protein